MAAAYLILLIGFYFIYKINERAKGQTNKATGRTGTQYDDDRR